MIFPAILGASGNLFFLFFVLTYLALYKWIAKPSEAEIDEAMHEHSREFLVNRQIKETWLLEKLQQANIDTKHKTEEELAKALFDYLDADKSGFLDTQEVKQILTEWKTSQSFIENFMNKYGSNGKIYFDSFYRNVWNIGNLEARIFSIQKTTAKTEEDKARLIFSHLDTDNSGYIEVLELRKLLLEWGLPAKEVEAYLQKYDDGDQRFSFEEFFKYMRPIWRFAYSTAGERN
jgi:Ca2+-binding EF-hand superfamily protein